MSTSVATFPFGLVEWNRISGQQLSQPKDLYEQQLNKTSFDYIRGSTNWDVQTSFKPLQY